MSWAVVCSRIRERVVRELSSSCAVVCARSHCTAGLDYTWLVREGAMEVKSEAWKRMEGIHRCLKGK
jgi:hypothetical protein